jgi:hypothetical protein
MTQHIDELLTGYATDEAAKCGPGYRVSLAWGPELVTVEADAGRPQVPLPHWLMLVTAPNPDLSGQVPRLMDLKDLGYGEPTEYMVREAVRSAAGKLGELGRRKLAELGNGHGAGRRGQ